MNVTSPGLVGQACKSRFFSDSVISWPACNSMCECNLVPPHTKRTSVKVFFAGTMVALMENHSPSCSPKCHARAGPGWPDAGNRRNKTPFLRQRLGHTWTRREREICGQITRVKHLRFTYEYYWCSTERASSYRSQRKMGRRTWVQSRELFWAVNVASCSKCKKPLYKPKLQIAPRRVSPMARASPSYEG